MAATKVMTLRIDAALLEQLRETARAEQRSLSAQVLFLVRKELGAGAKRRRSPLPTLGWLSHLAAPDDVAAFRRVRRSLSQSLAARTRRTGTRR